VALSNSSITSVFLCVNTLNIGGWLLEDRITAKNGVQAYCIQLVDDPAVTRLHHQIVSPRLQVMLHPLSEAKTKWF